MKKNLLLLFAIILTANIAAKPPKPPKGFRWVVNETFSDEFAGTQLDETKWQNYYNGGWQGRKPAWFNPDAIKVEDGFLKIQSGVLDKPKGRNGEYTMYGGAVSSKTKGAHFGYYECRAKASKIAMSTTFWMSNDKVPFVENDSCENDAYSQELDIQECVGGSTTFEKFKYGMNSNTHYRYIKCGEKKETFISKGAHTKLKSPVYEEFHTYGAWWKNENEVTFFADDEPFDTVQFRTDISPKPFKRPMQINMVTETYDWQPAPSNEDLSNNEINTALYDWVRSYKLISIKEKSEEKSPSRIFENAVNVSGKIMDGQLTIAYTYSNNEDCKIIFVVLDTDGKQLQNLNVGALAGYGYDELTSNIKKKYLDKRPLKIKAQMISEINGHVDVLCETVIQ